MTRYTLLAHRCELSSPGDYVRVPGTDMLAYNDGGTVIVTDGVCPHRGALMLDKSHGNAPLTCPYHGWSYRSGKMRVPDYEKYRPAELAKAQLRQFITRWVGDWLFAAITPDAEMPDARILELLQEISITRRHAFDTMPISCDWRVAVENTLEDAHVPMVHRDSFQRLGLKRGVMQNFSPDSFAVYEVTDPRILKVGANLEKYFDNSRASEYFHLFLYPNVCIASLGGFTFSMQHYVPGPMGTAFTSRLYAGAQRHEAPDLAGFYNNALEFNRQVFREDAEICARVSGFGHALSSDEERVRWFREARREFI